MKPKIIIKKTSLMGKETASFILFVEAWMLGGPCTYMYIVFAEGVKFHQGHWPWPTVNEKWLPVIK